MESEDREKDEDVMRNALPKTEACLSGVRTLGDQVRMEQKR